MLQIFQGISLPRNRKSNQTQKLQASSIIRTGGLVAEGHRNQTSVGSVGYKMIPENVVAVKTFNISDPHGS